LFADAAWESVTGENAATVGGFGSLLAKEPPSSSLRDEPGVLAIIQGVSYNKISHGWWLSLEKEGNVQMQPFVMAKANLLLATSRMYAISCATGFC
jgi:hypothetical protein